MPWPQALFPGSKAGRFAPAPGVQDETKPTMYHAQTGKLSYKNLACYTLQVKTDTASLFTIAAKHLKIPTQSISCRNPLKLKVYANNF